MNDKILAIARWKLAARDAYEKKQHLDRSNNSPTQDCAEAREYKAACEALAGLVQEAFAGTLPVRVQHGRLGLHSPLVIGHVVTIEEGVYSRTGRTTGNVDESRGIKITAYAATAEHPNYREAVAVEILFAPDVFDPDATNRIGTQGAYVDQRPAQDEIDATVERLRAHLEQGRGPIDRVIRTNCKPGKRWS